jgi:hypothetical protein
MRGCGRVASNADKQRENSGVKNAEECEGADNALLSSEAQAAEELDAPVDAELQQQPQRRQRRCWRSDQVMRLCENAYFDYSRGVS